ncbi:MAG: hypothetical protein K5664_00610 [Firmicutes bacterium]|nr:hypothetical protein [Bacillota bacterium]
MKKINKFLSLMLLMAFILVLLSPCMTVLGADTVKISTAEDFLQFAKNCKKDSWSKDKRAELICDIDFAKTEFKCVPTFGGHFNGNGYAIKNVKIEDKGSYKGIFRYIQADGVVENLTVYANVAPSGSQKFIGGICGENSGTINNCTFTGDVSGSASVGGICGYQKESGKISDCICSGTVSGKSYTGGICGQNYGTLENCTNEASVNAEISERGKSIQDIDLNIDLKETDKTELLDANTDTGGICGYSKGKIGYCTNKGDIGYKSLGYNTGGICGRNAGSITNCENYGRVKGRKDIGGICGQAEPYVLLEYSGDVASRIRIVMANLRYILQRGTSFDDAELSKSIDDVGNSMSSMADNTDSLINGIADYADEAADTANDVVDRISSAMTQSKGSFDNIYNGMTKLSEGLSALKEGGEYVKSAIEAINADDKGRNSADFKNANKYLTKSLDEMSRGLSDLDSAIVSLGVETDNLQKAVEDLKDALKNHKDAEDEFLKIFGILQNIQSGYSQAGGSISDIASAIAELQKNGYTVLPKDAVENMESIAKSYIEIGKAISGLADAMLTFSDGLDIMSLRRGMALTRHGLDDLSTSLYYFNRIIKRMENVPEAKESASDAIDKINEGMGYITAGTEALSLAAKELNEAAESVENEGFKHLPKPSDSLSVNIDSLHGSISGFRNGFEDLRGELSGLKNRLRDDVYDTTYELEKLSDILYDAYSESLNMSRDDVTQDISDYDDGKNPLGKIENSTNYADVEGDINVGGVCGQMGIEYDFDPEDDVKKDGDKSLEFTYKTKCVLRRCENEGFVTSKRDCCGGICGKMDLGSIISCGNYADVKTESGNYTGGIAGSSDTVIRNCAAKCTICGGDYVGGIAGKGEKISNCRTIVSIREYGEFRGAIAGFADTKNLSGNYFVSDELGGVDDISYLNVADECSVGEFNSFVKSDFDRDVEFKLSFEADGKEIFELTFNYGDDITDQIPKIPKKSGYYGKWSDYDFSHAEYDAKITAEYYRNMDIISSDEKRDGGKAVILVCGAFDHESSVSSAENRNIGGKIIDARDVELINCFADKYEIRYLPKSEKNVKIMVDYGKGKQNVSARKYGSYLQFTVHSPNFTVYEVETSYVWVFVFVILILLLLVFAYFVINRKFGSIKTTT